MRRFGVEQHRPLRAFRLAVQSDVGRLQIEVQDAGGVESPERLGQLRTQLERSRGDDATARAQLVRERRIASAAVHDEERGPELDSAVQELRDARMLELRQVGEALDLREEPLHRRRVRRVRVQKLHHDGGAVRRLRQPGGGEAARSELVHELAPGDVALAQVRARLGRHVALALGAERLVRERGRERRTAMRALCPRGRGAQFDRARFHSGGLYRRVSAGTDVLSTPRTYSWLIL
jgi:hypothetical protein